MQETKYVLQFSGGRDSIALLLTWPHKEETTVVWVDAGGALDELTELVYRLTQGWQFIHYQTDAAGWIIKHGIPADVVPIWETGVGKVLSQASGQSIVSALECCENNIMKPLHLLSHALTTEYIVRGQRNAETLKSPIRNGTVIDGIEYLFPLQDWTDEQVNDCLKEHGVFLPEWYTYGEKGFDCWWCTGYTQESRGLWRYLQQHHEQKFALVQARLRYIQLKVLPYIQGAENV